MKAGLNLGEWYPVEELGYICANENPYHGCMRLGLENNLLFFLDGGGLSWSEYTAARPIGTEKEGYYIDELGPVSVMNDRPGLTNAEPWNLFKKWNVFVVHYGTGDIHIGRNEFAYRALTQESKVLHHCGYRNFQLILERAKLFCQEPEKILIAGVSAGALGAAALAEEIVQSFPKCKNITCCVDGGLAYADWKTIATQVWNAPRTICERLHGHDIVLDCLMDLNRIHGDRVQCLYISSTRDAILAWFQQALDGEVPSYTKEAGDQYQKMLAQTCKVLVNEIPEAGVYIYDYESREAEYEPEAKLTQHTILTSNNIIDDDGKKPSVIQWLWDCVHGRVEQVGLELLD